MGAKMIGIYCIKNILKMAKMLLTICRYYNSMVQNVILEEIMDILTNETEKEVNELVKNFIKEMRDWEIFCNKISESKKYTFEEENNKQKERCKNIFDKYCTPKDRKQGRPNCISYGIKGSFIYNETEKIIKIEQENKNKILVITNGEDEVDKYMYIVFRKNGKWLIDGKKRKFFDEEKFKNINL
jgi:hypothetical protein